MYICRHDRNLNNNINKLILQRMKVKGNRITSDGRINPFCVHVKEKTVKEVKNLFKLMNIKFKKIELL